METWKSSAPHALYCHPREEHLLPLFVCLGAGSRAEDRAKIVFEDVQFGCKCTGFMFDSRLDEEKKDL